MCQHPLFLLFTCLLTIDIITSFIFHFSGGGMNESYGCTSGAILNSALLPWLHGTHSYLCAGLWRILIWIGSSAWAVTNLDDNSIDVRRRKVRLHTYEPQMLFPTQSKPDRLGYLLSILNILICMHSNNVTDLRPPSNIVLQARTFTHWWHVAVAGGMCRRLRRLSGCKWLQFLFIG